MKKHEYIASLNCPDSAKNFPSVEIENISGMLKFIEAQESKIVLLQKNTDQSPDNIFFVLSDNVVYKFNGKKFETLEDYLEAETTHFPDSAQFYEARKLGFTHYDEYLQCKDMGGDKKDEYTAATRAGFVKGYESFRQKYEKYKEGKYTSDISPDIDNPVQLYRYAVKNGFNIYKDFEKVYDAGFPDYLSWKDAQTKGFKTAADFFSAVKSGFGDAKEFKEAAELLIATKKEYDAYSFLRLSAKNISFDECQLLNILRIYSNGTKPALSELKEKLETEQSKLMRTFGKEGIKILPLWYSKKLDSKEKFEGFLSENENIKRLGFYDKDNECFEMFRLSRTKVYVDGSNVAYNNSTDALKKAQFRNIKLVVDELKAKGFADITVIADATLRHRAKDENYLKILKKEINYREVPSHTTADEFIIQNARNDKCLIISNDTFNDWKIKDKWLANNIDSIRLPFMINNDKVIFSGIDKHLANI